MGITRPLVMLGRLTAKASTVFRDRLLLALLGLGCLVVALPLTQSPLVPITDLGSHVGLASQLPRLLLLDDTAWQYYRLNPVPGQNLTVYVVIGLLSSLFGSLFAAKAIVFVALVAPTFGLMRLATALGRSPRIALWALALAWDFNLSIGFLAVNIGTGVAAWYLGALLDRYRRGAKLDTDLGLIALGLLVGFTHVQAALLVLACSVALALAEISRGLRFRKVVPLVGLGLVPVLTLVPWVVRWFSRSPSPPALPDLGTFPDIATRAAQLFLATLDVANVAWARNFGGAVYLLLLLLPLVYAIVFPGGDLARRRSLAVYLAVWVLYLTLPDRIYWPTEHVLVEQRYAVAVLAFGLTMVPGKFVGRQVLLLLPGLVGILLTSSVAVWQARQFRPYGESFLSILGSVKPNSRISPVLWQLGTPESVRFTLSHVPSYLVAEKGGYSPHLFRGAALPVELREQKELKGVSPFEPGAFQSLVHARGYDYVLVQGERPWTPPPRKPTDEANARVPERPGPPQYLSNARGLVVRLETRAGPWQLYVVEEDAGANGPR